MDRPTPGVLFITPWDLDSAGGVNQVVLNLFRMTQHHLHFQPYHLVQKWESPYVSMATFQNRPTIYMRLYSPWGCQIRLKQLVSFIFHLLPTAYRLLRLIRQHRIKVINIHYPGLSCVIFALLKSLKLYRGPLILSFHGTDLNEITQSSPGLRRLWLWFFSQCEGLVACSQALTHLFLHAFPEARHKIHVILNGIDPEVTAQELNACVPILTYPQPYLVNVATYEAKKGQDLLIDAFALIADQFPSLNLIFAGRMGAYYAVLQKKIATSPYKNRIFMLIDLGHGQALQLIKAAQIFVLPSRVESFGLVILEAGLCETPVIACDTGGIPEIIQHNRHGLLFPLENTAALGEALKLLLTNPDLGVAYSKALKQRVIHQFSWKAAYDSYLKLFTGNCH